MAAFRGWNDPTKSRPILFRGEMVRAILDGRKTQTRRLLKPMAGKQSKWLTPYLLNRVPEVRVTETSTRGGPRDPGVQLTHPRGGPLGWIRSPYGGPGDRLWVKETWRVHENYDKLRPKLVVSAMGGDYRGCTDYLATPGNEPFWGKTRVSIFMPAEFSRITLDVTDVRVERLQDISTDDVDAEGFGGDWPHTVFPELFNEERDSGMSMQDCYGRLWESINGDGSWTLNPYVWVISFKRVPPHP